VTRVCALSTRLARLALDVDQVALAIAAEPLTRPDSLLLTAPTQQLHVAVGVIEQTLFELDHHGEAPWPRIAVESDRLAA
jgi:hypothetical protein